MKAPSHFPRLLTMCCAVFYSHSHLRGQDFERVPEKLREDAKTAFSDGKQYFIWKDDDSPIRYSKKAAGVFSALFKFSYLANNDAPRFAVHFDIPVAQGGSGLFGLHSFSHDLPKFPQTSAGGAPAFFTAADIKGEGPALFYLIKESDVKKKNPTKNPDPISNKLRIYISPEAK